MAAAYIDMKDYVHMDPKSLLQRPFIGVYGSKV